MNGSYLANLMCQTIWDTKSTLQMWLSFEFKAVLTSTSINRGNWK